MSATNRGSKRVASDYYKTPSYSIKSLLDNHKLRQGVILECSAGDGAIIKELREYGYKNKIIANELREEENKNLLASGSDEVYHLDFTKEIVPSSESVSTIISNPPYSIAVEFLEACLEHYPYAEVIMLLRLNFLGAQKRQEFWNKHLPNTIYALSKRPGFLKKGTDACEYGWFVWNNTDKQKIKVI
jgi:hypothetical protein